MTIPCLGQQVSNMATDAQIQSFMGRKVRFLVHLIYFQGIW